ncbi:hypothetical protein GCM10027052_13660 [Parafrigoribacterium mesophilum]
MGEQTEHAILDHSLAQLRTDIPCHALHTSLLDKLVQSKCLEVHGDKREHRDEHPGQQPDPERPAAGTD